MENKVLVIGGNHQNPLGIIEAMGQKGISSYAIIYSNCKKSFVLRSKYVKKGWICPTLLDVLRCIYDNFKDTKNKTVAYACCDDIAGLLNDYYDSLKDVLSLSGIPVQGKLSEWMSKEKMAECAQSIGLIVPPTWMVNRNRVPDGIEYPCVTKSISSVHNGKTEFFLCKDKNELENTLKNHVHSDTIQVQKYIDKDFEFQYLGCSLNGGETIIIPGRTHVEAAFDFNNLTFLKFQECKVIEDSMTLSKIEEFIKIVGYSGLFSVEFMHGRDGKDYFLEMNFRNDGNGIVVTAAGTNMPYMWYLYQTGGDYLKEIAESTVKDTYSCPEDSYFMLMLRGYMSFGTWYRNMKRVTCPITYFKGDTGPFWGLMWLQKRNIAISIIQFLFRTGLGHKKISK